MSDETRPPPSELRIEKCAIGYLLETGSPRGELGMRYAFDEIRGVCDWLINTYGFKDTPEELLRRVQRGDK